MYQNVLTVNIDYHIWNNQIPMNPNAPPVALLTFQDSQQPIEPFTALCSVCLVKQQGRSLSVKVVVINGRIWRGGDDMKDFAEFKQSLTEEVFNKIDDDAIDYANEMIDKYFSKEDYGLRLANHPRFYSKYTSLALLEMYHEWLNT